MQPATAQAEQALGLRHTYRAPADSESALVLLVHGRAGNYSAMSTFLPTIPGAYGLIAPQAPVVDALGGYSWWSVDAENTLDQALVAARKLKIFIEDALGYYELDPQVIVGCGFSQGGAVLALIAQEAPALFGGIALLASFFLKHPSVPIQAYTSFPRVFIGHGINDDVVPIEKARKGRELLEELGVEVRFHEDDVSHKVGTEAVRGLKDWISEFVEK